MLSEKSEKLNLFWLCPQSGKKIPAGVAFYNEMQGDYSLKIDTFCEDKLVYLKIVACSEGLIRYRVDAVPRKGGQKASRKEIGYGQSNAKDGSPIVMELGPYSKTLILEPQAA